MMIRWPRNEKRKQEEQVKLLVADREETRKRILRIREKMEKTVQSGISADALDRKLFSSDYQILRDELQAETQHLGDVNKLISQMRSADLTRTRAEAMERMTEAAGQIDLRKMIEMEEETNIRREMMREEDEAYRELLSESGRTGADFSEDAEYARLVAEAKLNRMAKGLPEPVAEPMEA